MKDHDIARRHLARLLAEMAPGMWLTVGGRVMASCFGDRNAIDAAKQLARNHHCVFKELPNADPCEPAGEFACIYAGQQYD